MRRTFIILAALFVLASLAYANPLCTTNSIAYYQANYQHLERLLGGGHNLLQL